MRLRSRHVRELAVAAALASFAGCHAAPPGDAGQSAQSVTPRVAERRAALDEVRAFEAARRDELDFATLPGADVASGPNPFDVLALPGGGYAGILRGRAAVVQLDSELREVRRLGGPRGATGLAIAPNGEIWVTGELDARVFRYRLRAGLLEPTEALASGTTGVRDVAVGSEGAVHLLDAWEGRVLTLQGGQTHATAACRSGTALMRAGSWLIANCLFEHALKVWRVDARGRPNEPAVVISHDGPFWSFDAAPSGHDLLVAAGGVEDHPLDRTIGSFGFVDSYLWLYRVAQDSAIRMASVNLSEHGVVVPKTVRLDAGMDLRVDVTGFGSDRRASIGFDARGAQRDVSTAALPPGTSAAIRAENGDWVLANPLLDVWLRVTGDTTMSVPVPDEQDGRSPQERVGELLVFTTLIAPNNTSDGPLSRFTCETCHFEGGVDGRVHHTGRGNVRVSTKPLLGLLNNRPYFSRALDRDLTAVAHNEFRVAGAGSGADPWFSVRIADVPWLRALKLERRELSAGWLRQAFVAFLAAYHPPPNALALASSRFGESAAQGAALFRDRCEGCHQARRVSDDPSTRLAFEDWERAVLHGRGPVWAKDEYERTGIEPYVHERGARVPSLRRLQTKWPYFTDGSARDLSTVLDAARFADDRTFWHRAVPLIPHRRLSMREKAALLAFLRLL
jgi:hypothetical protein